MRKIVFFLLFAFFLPSVIYASGFQLTSIGTMNVTGANSGEWWYTTANPTLTGETTQNGTIDITLDGSTQSVMADANGVWSFTPSAPEGDHSVQLVSNGSTIAFTLHITSVIPDTVSAPTTNDIPVAGNSLPTQIIFIAGALFLLGGMLFRTKNHPQP